LKASPGFALFAVSRRFVSAWVVHRLAMEFRAARNWSFTTRGQPAVITLAIVEMVIDVTVEMIRPVIPGSGADEYAA
jgi:hypothetical protein